MPRIIIVEGDHSFRKMLWLTFVKMGYEVVEAVNGSEAMKLHRCLPADLLMTDLIMPEQGGLETIQEFHHRHPQVKIIAISGEARTSARDSLGIGMMLGASRIFTKPFSIQEIACALKELMPAY